MSQPPLVSVIVPTYNRNKYLRQCLKSVYSQVYDNIEVVVVDDSGTENAKKVINEFEDVRYIPLDENQGPTRARNKGIESASGEYIQLLLKVTVWF